MTAASGDTHRVGVSRVVAGVAFGLSLLACRGESAEVADTLSVPADPSAVETPPKPHVLADVPDAYSLVSEEEAAAMLGVETKAVTTGGTHQPQDSSCAWLASDGRQMSVGVGGGRTRVYYGDITPEQYAEKLSLDLLKSGELIDHDPEMGEGAYLLRTREGFTLVVDTNLAPDSQSPLFYLVWAEARGWEAEDPMRAVVLDLARRMLAAIDASRGS